MFEYINKLSPAAVHYTILAALVAYSIECIVLSAVSGAWQIQVFGGAYTIFGIYCLYSSQAWLLTVLWVFSLLVVVAGNFAAISVLILVYTSEAALYVIAGNEKKPDLGTFPLIVSMILLANDLFTAVFLLILRKQIRIVKKRDGKASRPKEPSPRAISELNQQMRENAV